MPPSQFFVTSTISFLAGVLLGSFRLGAGLWPWPVSLATASGVGLGLCLILVLAELSQLPNRRHHKVLVLAGVLAMFCFGVVRFEWSVQESKFSRGLNAKGEWEGVVVEDADVRLNSRQLVVRLEGARQNILVITDPDKDVTYGDRVLLRGSLTEPEKFEGSDFDYKEYLKMNNVYALMRRPQVIVLRRGQGSVVKSFLFGAKSFLVERVGKFVPEPQASLLIGILIGARKTLPEEIVEQFNKTGLSHIVAVSGYNISIIIVSLGFLGKFLGSKLGFIISFVIIIGFVIMTGGSSSIVRAGIMGGLLLVAGLVGRPYAVTPSLLASAGIMVLLNPRVLFWDKGFQLSFTATAGIVYVLPYLEKLFEKVPDWLELKSILLTTFAATWFTWPLLIEGFGRVSFVAPLANLLVLPFLPWLMLFGFCILIPGIGAGFAFLSNLILLYILKILEILSNFSWASGNIESSVEIFGGALAVSLTGYILLRMLVKKQARTETMSKFGLGRLS